MDASPGSKERDKKNIQPFPATEVNKSPSKVIHFYNNRFYEKWFSAASNKAQQPI